jgi:hypothetical protein
MEEYASGIALHDVHAAHAEECMHQIHLRAREYASKYVQKGFDNKHVTPQPHAAAPQPHAAAPQPPAAAPQSPAAAQPPTAAPQPHAATPQPPSAAAQPPAAAAQPPAAAAQPPAAALQPHAAAVQPPATAAQPPAAAAQPHAAVPAHVDGVLITRRLTLSEAGLTSENSSNVNGDGPCVIEDGAEYAYTSDEACDEAVAMQEAECEKKC